MEVIEILVKMTIQGSISVKIDEENGVISIAFAELPMFPIEVDDKKGM